MSTYIVKRIAVSLIVLVALATASFLLIHLVPGDPVRQMLGSGATPQALASTRHQLGLDRPLLEQFGEFMGNTFTGHFGDSITLQTPIGQLIGERIGPSFLLISYGVVIALLIGVPLAVLAALKPQGVADNVIRILTTFTFAMPTFWLGLVLALIFGLKLGIFPVSGYETGVAGFFKTLTLPALTLGLSLVAMVVRTLRTRMLTVLDSEYIEAARARGLSEKRIVAVHAMRNSIMTTITVISVQIGFLIGGTVVLEYVFQIPGMGTLLLDSVTHRDFPLVATITVLAGAAVVLVSLLTDLIQLALDPRVREAHS